MLKILFICASLLAGTPQPADNYYSDVSPDTAEIVLNYVMDGEYHEFLDFNGDGELNIADVVGIRKRYEDNCKYGNKITVDSEVINMIYEENFREAALDTVIRYKGKTYKELTVSKITTAEVWYTFADCEEGVRIKINPYTESIRVINWEE